MSSETKHSAPTYDDMVTGSVMTNQLLKLLCVIRDTLPHMGGNAMSTHSLLQDIDAAISKVTGSKEND